MLMDGSMIIAGSRPVLLPSTADRELDKERLLMHRRYGQSRHVSQSHYGNIYRVTEPRSGDEFIVKMVSRLYLGAQTNIFYRSETRVLVSEDVILEGHILAKSRVLPHPNVAAAAPALCSLNSPSHYGLAMPVYNGGDLYNWLDAHGRLPARAAVRLVLHLLEGVRHLHCVLGYTHNDISLENVLLHFDELGDPVEQATPVLIDFGLATPFGEAPQIHSFKPAYRAPELFSAEGLAAFASSSSSLAASWSASSSHRHHRERNVGGFSGGSGGGGGRGASAAAVTLTSTSTRTTTTAASAACGAGDVYSCGMVLFYLVAGAKQCYNEPTPGDRGFHQFLGPRLPEIIQHLSRGSTTPSAAAAAGGGGDDDEGGCSGRVGVPAEVCHLIQRMTRADPAQRASVDEAIKLAAALLAQLTPPPTATMTPTTTTLDPATATADGDDGFDDDEHINDVICWPSADSRAEEPMGDYAAAMLAEAVAARTISGGGASPTEAAALSAQQLALGVPAAVAVAGATAGGSSKRRSSDEHTSSAAAQLMRPAPLHLSRVLGAGGGSGTVARSEAQAPCKRTKKQPPQQAGRRFL
jgi:serine/threonine protein kinase